MWKVLPWSIFFENIRIIFFKNIYFWTFCWILSMCTILRIVQEVLLYKIISLLSLIHCYDMNTYSSFSFGLPLSPRGVSGSPFLSR